MAKFCTNCGAKLESGKRKCVSCGKEITTVINEAGKDDTNFKSDTTPMYRNNKSKIPLKEIKKSVNNKSKIAAGLLGVFLGVFGVHNFYLGYTSKATTQLILGTAGALLCGIGPVISSIWGFVEGILILTGSINKDAEGNDLTD